MQDLPRLYADPQQAGLATDATLPMADGQAHYLGHVLRRQPGDRVRLFNGTDGEWLGAIEALRRDRGSFRLLEQVRPAEPEPGPMLVFAPLKRDATDLVVRMATELGAAALAPVITERSNAARINAGRWQAIAIEAAEQCERLSLPAIAELVRLPDLLGGWNPQRPLLAAIERAGERDAGQPVSIATWRARAEPLVQPGLLIGPEGGFSDAELHSLRACRFVVPISLGRRILRAETASLAALAALQV